MFFIFKIMITYLKYKFLIFHRKISHFGLPPVLIYPITFLAFFFLKTQFENHEYAEIITFFLFANTMHQLTPKKKEREWLFFCEKKESYLLLVNTLIALPFILYFFYINYYYSIILAVPLTFLMSFYTFNFSLSILEKVNLSFLMKDFEFIEGIRRYWYIHLITATISIIGFFIDNYSLAMIGYLGFIITFGFYYQKVEPVYWIWIFKQTSKEFINLKITSLLKKTLLLSLVFFIVYIFFTKNIDIIFMISASCLGVVNCMLSKYAYLKNLFSIQISLTISIFMIIIIPLNPLFLIIGLIYFSFLKKKAINNITQIKKN